MKSLKKFAILGAVLAASSTFALADSINGSFFIQGNDSYTTSMVTFGSASVGAGMDTGTTGISGTFASFLVDGDQVAFTSPIVYTQGTTVLPAAALAFTIYAPNGTTALFTYDVTQYTAAYTSCSGQSGAPCYGNTGDTFLNIIGNGYFTGENAAAVLGSNAGTFDFSTQTVLGQTATDFSVSAGANAISATPEPNSLLLLGTGLMGAAGLLFTRRRNATNLA